MSSKRRVGVVGYGKVGQFLAQEILGGASLATGLELAFVWNRNPEAIGDEVRDELKLRSLLDFASFKPDLIVEVSHPDISAQFGTRFLECCDFLVGSPTVFGRKEVERGLKEASHLENGHGLYIPRGALPGLEEVLRMAEEGRLSEASITMRKHPSSLKLRGKLADKLLEQGGERVLYDGPLGPLCELAPNNVNTMAVLAMASGLGFDRTAACLVADEGLSHHVTELGLQGPGTREERYSLELVRRSPAGAGAVTSTATLTSFLRSVAGARDAGNGVHFR